MSIVARDCAKGPAEAVEMSGSQMQEQLELAFG